MKPINNLTSIQKLKEQLEQDPTLKHYREIGTKVHENEELLVLYKQYITLQKELVNLEYYKKEAAKAQKERELQELESRLYDIPLFNQYIQTQVELEELFQTMTHLIQDNINRFLEE